VINWTRRLLLLTTVLGLTVGGTAARAEFPDKPVRFILGFSPGGGVDIQARIVSDALQKKWGQTIVIESRAGANGSIAAEFVSRAPPDGYTLVWVSNAHTATPSLLKLNYDAIKSFAPITQVTRTPDVFIVQPSLPAKTLQEFIALARSKPGELNYASVGTGGAPFLEMEMLMKQTGIKLNHVPYKGGGDAVMSVLTDSTQCYFGVIATMLGHIQSGQLRPLALSSDKRSPAPRPADGRRSRRPRALRRGGQPVDRRPRAGRDAETHRRQALPGLGRRPDVARGQAAHGRSRLHPGRQHAGRVHRDDDQGHSEVGSAVEGRAPTIT